MTIKELAQTLSEHRGGVLRLEYNNWQLVAAGKESEAEHVVAKGDEPPDCYLLEALARLAGLTVEWA